MLINDYIFVVFPHKCSPKKKFIKNPCCNVKFHSTLEMSNECVNKNAKKHISQSSTRCPEIFAIPIIRWEGDGLNGNGKLHIHDSLPFSIIFPGPRETVLMYRDRVILVDASTNRRMNEWQNGSALNIRNVFFDSGNKGPLKKNIHCIRTYLSRSTEHPES